MKIFVIYNVNYFCVGLGKSKFWFLVENNDLIRVFVEYVVVLMILGIVEGVIIIVVVCMFVF